MYMQSAISAWPAGSDANKLQLLQMRMPALQQFTIAYMHKQACKPLSHNGSTCKSCNVWHAIQDRNSCGKVETAVVLGFMRLYPCVSMT